MESVNAALVITIDPIGETIDPEDVKTGVKGEMDLHNIVRSTCKFIAKFFCFFFYFLHTEVVDVQTIETIDDIHLIEDHP